MANAPLHSESAQSKAPSALELENARDSAEDIFALLVAMSQSEQFGDRQQSTIRAVCTLMHIHLDSLTDLSERAYEAQFAAQRGDNVAEFPG
jgi:alpha-D-ribose 1-methylphosphonate 5-triphosphate diphosphatase PhnM